MYKRVAAGKIICPVITNFTIKPLRVVVKRNTWLRASPA
jgi:hypothetical protein